MAKKRKGTTRKPAKRSAKPKRVVMVQATPAQHGKPGPAGKLSQEDTVTALLIAAAIVIFLVGLYVFQQHV